MWNPLKTKPLLDFDWVRENIPSRSQVEYTPDFMWLERHEWCLIFFYDEMMSNRRLYEKFIKEDSLNLGKAFTNSCDWSLWKKKLGTETFPIALEGADRVYSGPGISSVKLNRMDPSKVTQGILGRIKGEVHAIRPHIFWKELDKHYLNGVDFTRQRVSVLIPYHIRQGSQTIDHNEFIQELRVWMYVGNRDYWINQLDGGLLYSPVGAFKPKIKWIDGHDIGTYYHYSRLEYDTNA
ncbi:MAG: hypothetical protein KGI25_08485 [Thaumarchaeota archaeon]|nr:hypothetical protein [Nitrososphaerota archaeon]